MSDTPSLLQIAGFSEEDEQVYYLVLHRGKTTVRDVAERSAISHDDATARLERLRDRGYISQASGQPETYTPVDPRYALAATTDRLTEQVGRIRAQIPVFADQFDRMAAEATGVPETHVLSDPAEIAAWYVRLQHQATRDLMIFDRPPYISSPLEPLEIGSIRGGVRWRGLYTADSFSRSGAWEEVLRLGDHGEESRVVPTLPIKLVLVDRAIALVSLALDASRPMAMVTESAPLVEVLCDTFERHWQRGLPLPSDPEFGGLASAPSGDSPATRGPRPEEQSLVALIGAGLVDEEIADRLGISVRSLRRRSQSLMLELGASNRFQAGVEAARRGWV